MCQQATDMMFNMQTSAGFIVIAWANVPSFGYFPNALRALLISSMISLRHTQDLQGQIRIS